MRISYHKETDTLYIHLSEEPSVESEEIAPDVVVDYAEGGKLVGFEIDHASRLMDPAALEADSVPIAR